MDRVSADNMGMLSTVINAIALQDSLEKRGVQCRVMSAVFMNQLAEPYIRRRAVRHLEKGRVVIFAAGIGNPFFSTDTAASLRAMEIKADVLLKGTKVEGVYNADPVLVKDAVKYDEITYMEILRQGLKVMDLTAVSLCKDNNLPMIIFNMNQPGNIRRVVTGRKGRIAGDGVTAVELEQFEVHSVYGEGLDSGSRCAADRTPGPDSCGCPETSKQQVEMSKPARLNALTGLRCFAAINIVFFHFSNPQWFGSLAPVVNAGYASVSFFILLSGFVLAYNYAARARAGELEQGALLRGAIHAALSDLSVEPDC